MSPLPVEIRTARPPLPIVARKSCRLSGGVSVTGRSDSKSPLPVVAWMFAEWLTHGKPSALGIASGVVAGLVAITPAAGTVGPMGALVIGLAAGVICFVCATTLKRKMGYDDSLDAFGVHGIGGIVGAILTGVFAAPALGGFGTVEDIGAQDYLAVTP